MADTIAVMNRGRIEQLGPPSELYERPRTAFVAGFLGVSNLLPGTVAGPDVVRLRDGTEVRARLDGRSGDVAVGIRPEKIRLDADAGNTLPGFVAERAYVGVATQYVVKTGAGHVTVYVQNAESGGAALGRDDAVTLAFDPESTFVVDQPEEET